MLAVQIFDFCLTDSVKQTKFTCHLTETSVKRNELLKGTAWDLPTIAQCLFFIKLALFVGFFLCVHGELKKCLDLKRRQKC